MSLNAFLGICTNYGENRRKFTLDNHVDVVSCYEVLSYNTAGPLVLVQGSQNSKLHINRLEHHLTPLPKNSVL